MQNLPSTMNKPVECEKQCRRDATVEVTNNYGTRQVGAAYEHVIQLDYSWESCRENPERLRDTMATMTISGGMLVGYLSNTCRSECVGDRWSSGFLEVVTVEATKFIQLSNMSRSGARAA